MRRESWEVAEGTEGLDRLPIRSGRFGGNMGHVHNGSKGTWWNVGWNATMLIILTHAAWESRFARSETGLEVSRVETMADDVLGWDCLGLRVNVHLFVTFNGCTYMNMGIYY